MKEKRKQLREELECIEKVIHNLPKINDCDICHSHHGRIIRFTAWRNSHCLEGKYINIPRCIVLELCKSGDFLAEYRDDFEWLTRE